MWSLLCLLCALVLLVQADVIHNGPGEQKNLGMECSDGKTEYLKDEKSSFFTSLGVVIGIVVIIVVGALIRFRCQKKE